MKKEKKAYKHNREWDVSYNWSAVTISGTMPGKTLGKGGGGESISQGESTFIA